MAGPARRTDTSRQCHIPKYFYLDTRPWGPQISVESVSYKNKFTIHLFHLILLKHKIILVVGNQCLLLNHRNPHINLWLFFTAETLKASTISNVPLQNGNSAATVLTHDFTLCLDILLYKPTLKVLWVRSVVRQHQLLPIWILLLCPFVC